MDEFLREIKEYSKDDLQLILTDQRDLYTSEELEIIQQELNARGGASTDFSVEEAVQATLEDQFAQNIREEERKRQLEELAKLEQQRKVYQARIRRLKNNGYDGYWEYRVISLSDTHDGSIDPQRICDLLNELGLDGWRLKCAYSNELGHNSSSGGMGGFSTGTNSTVDQNILILERFVRIDGQDSPAGMTESIS